MKTIIAGSRSISQFNILLNAIKKAPFEVTEVIHGGARGADLLGDKYAKIKELPFKVFIPDWATYGKRAGYLRNEEMANNGQALIALWDQESKGTKHMIDIATKKRLVVYVHMVNPLSTNVISQIKQHMTFNYKTRIYKVWNIDKSSSISFSEYDEAFAFASDYYYKYIDLN